MDADEQKVRARFEHDTAGHEMTVLRDDGLYRHLRFAAAGTYIYGFDLVTWPGYLAVVGDCGDYVFSRINDMFKFFESAQGGINPGYWAEKLRGPGRDMARVYRYEAFRARVLDWFTDVSEELDEDEAASLRAALDEQLLNDYDSEAQDESNARRLLFEFEHDGRRIHDSWEWDLREFDWQFLWCCWAIARGIRQYRAAQVAPGVAA